MYELFDLLLPFFRSCLQSESFNTRNSQPRRSGMASDANEIILRSRGFQKCLDDAPAAEPELNKELAASFVYAGQSQVIHKAVRAPFSEPFHQKGTGTFLPFLLPFLKG